MQSNYRLILKITTMADFQPNIKTDSKVRSRKNLVKMDMTPMVDLGFLLISFFMFTTNFNKPNVVDLSLPATTESQGNQIDLSNSITLILGENNRVFYHQLDQKSLTSDLLKEVSFDQFGLTNLIERAKKAAKNPSIFTVIIKPTDDANYKNFVDALDEMALTKSQHYGIADMRDWETKIYDDKLK